MHNVTFGSAPPCRPRRLEVFALALVIAVVGAARSGSPAEGQQALFLASGWNNVAYFGVGAPGSTILEQGSVWAWDSGSQHWNHHEPSSTSAAESQIHTPLNTYWNIVSSAPSNLTPPAGLQSSGCYQFSSLQPTLTEIDDAFTRAGFSALATDPQLAPAPERSGPSGTGLVQPPYIPPTILRAIGWVESGWRQATPATARGQVGATITSSGCAYGVMQLVTGMWIDSVPTPLQQQMGTDYQANISAGAQLLTKMWNRDSSALPFMGQHDPHILEDWYFAVWAFHCFGPTCAGYSIHDDPDDPSLPWPRPIYNSAEQNANTSGFTLSAYPYQELVYGLVANPPQVEGRPLWHAIPVQLPAHGTVGFPTPQAAIEASAHLEDGTLLPPTFLSR
jgi:hypothetical protein